MSTTDNSNQSVTNENASPLSQNSTCLNEAPQDASTDNPRRSIRLLGQSPDVNRRITNATNIHGTVSGGVASIVIHQR